MPLLVTLTLSPGVALGDVDGDGNVDAVFANSVQQQRNRVCLGDGTGSFTCSNVSENSFLSFGVALGDVDGDATLDAVFANFFQRNRVCLGDGTGSFTCSNVSENSFLSLGVALGDVDGDGNVDAVFANSDQPNSVCLGDGAGGFDWRGVSADMNTSAGVALGDVDGDGNVDAVFANSGQQQRNRVCLGNGAGRFACSNVSTDIFPSFGVALGFVDDDTDLDAVFANPGRNRVCLGDGAGGFACSDIADTFGGIGVALGFVDDDTDLDAVFANPGRNRVCLEDGAGGFPSSSCSDVSADTNNSRGVALAVPTQVQPAVFLIIDEDSIDEGNPPNFFTGVDVNKDIADLGLRTQLPFFAANVGKTITLHTGEVGDEGWFAVKTIPDNWATAGPTTDGLRNFVGNPSQPFPHNVGPGLGTGDDPESLLDKIPDVTPLRATGLKMVEGQQVCAVVFSGDISINYDPLDGSLKGANLGTVAFEVISVTQLTGFSPSSLPEVDIAILDADDVCEGELELFTDAPAPDSSSEPFDVKP